MPGIPATRADLKNPIQMGGATMALSDEAPSFGSEHRVCIQTLGTFSVRIGVVSAFERPTQYLR